MLRFTTNVTVSPASSPRSSSAAWRMSSIASGRVSANRAVSSSSASVAPSRPLAIAARNQVPADRALLAAAGAAARDEAPVAQLDHVEHALLDPVRVHVLGVDAEPLGERVAARREPLAHLVNRRERMLRARCGRRWPTGRRGRWRPPPRAEATSRTGSAGSARPRPASACAPRARAPACGRASPRSPMAAAGAARRASRCAAPRRRSRRAPRRSSAGGPRSSGGSPPGGARARRAARASARSASTRSSSLSPMPTRIPLVNGILSSPASRIVSSRSSGCLVGEPWCTTRSGFTDSSISPCEAVT